MLNLDDYEVTETSSGSLKLKRKTNSLSEYKGTWRDLGVAMEFVAKKDARYLHPRLFWWPDTNDKLLQYDAKDLIPKEGNLRSDAKDGKLKKKAWQIIEDGELCGFSMPTLCIRDLLLFMREKNSDDGFIGLHNVWDDADRVMARAQSIRVPRPHAKKWAVVHQFGPRWEYRGFIVRPKNTAVERYHGMEVIDDVINLSVPYFLGVTNRDEMQLAVTLMMREYDRRKPQLWDDACCMKFFNEESNFVAP